MELESGFEDDLQEALLDEAEHKLVGQQEPIVFGAIQFVRGRLERYGRDFDYNVQPLLDSLEPIEVDRSGGQLTIRFGWGHPAFPYLEYGTSGHTIEGDPILSFVWEERHNPPEWVKEQYDEEGDGYRVFLPEVTVAGVRETRAVRDALNWLRAEVQ